MGQREKGKDPEISISRKLLHPGQQVLGAEADSSGSLWGCGISTYPLLWGRGWGGVVCRVPPSAADENKSTKT